MTNVPHDMNQKGKLSKLTVCKWSRQGTAKRELLRTSEQQQCSDLYGWNFGFFQWFPCDFHGQRRHLNVSLSLSENQGLVRKAEITRLTSNYR